MEQFPAVRGGNPLDFNLLKLEWLRGFLPYEKGIPGDVIAIDGKTLRRSFNARNEKSAIHMVSAWSTANDIVLGQEKTAEKSNEITAIPELLNSLVIKGCIVPLMLWAVRKA